MAATVRASQIGLKRVDAARCRKGWTKSEKAWCDLATTSKATLKRFWAGEAIQQETFVKICQEVGIEDWESIVEAEVASATAMPPTQAPTRSHPAVYPTKNWIERPGITAQLLGILQDSCRLLVLSGMTGIGKTALIERIVPELDDSLAWVRLNLDDGSLAADFATSGAVLLRSLGREPSLEDQKDPQHLSNSILDRLCQHPCRVQIDSLERLLAGNEDEGWSEFADPCWQELFERFLARGNCESQLLVTTQDVPPALETAGDRYPRLWHGEELRGLDADEQMALFAKAGLSAAWESGDPNERGYLRRIGALYEGHPLVLRTIAEDIKAIACQGGSVARYWQECGFDRLEAKHPVRFSRQKLQRRVRDRVRQSLQRLPARSHALLLRASVYRRPVPSGFWRALVPELPEDAWLGAIDLLLSRGLAEEDWRPDAWLGAEEAVPLRSHNLVRQVAYGLLKRERSIWERAERTAAERWLAGYAAREGVERLETVRGYLEAFEHFCAIEDWEAAGKLFVRPIQESARSTLPWLLFGWGYYREQLRVCQQIASKVKPEIEVDCQKQMGTANLFLARYPEAIARYTKSLEIAREIGDRRGEGATLGNLGLAYCYLGEYRRAIDFHEQSLAISRDIRNRQGEGRDLGHLGNAYCYLGEYRRAIDFHEQRLEIVRDIGDRHGQGVTLSGLGNAYNNLGEYRRAIDFHEQALAISREIGARQGQGSVLGSLGLAYHSLGEYRQAINFHEQYLEIARDIGDQQGEGNALSNLGLAYNSLGEYRRAINFHEQALAISRDIGDRLGQGNALGGLGNAYNSLGEYRRAIDLFEQYLEIARDIGDRDGEGTALVNLGETQIKTEQYDESFQNLQAALAIFREIQATAHEAEVLKALAELHYETHNPTQALHHCTAALHLATELGIPLAQECEDLQRKIEDRLAGSDDTAE